MSSGQFSASNWLHAPLAIYFLRFFTFCFQVWFSPHRFYPKAFEKQILDHLERSMLDLLNHYMKQLEKSLFPTMYLTYNFLSLNIAVFATSYMDKMRKEVLIMGLDEIVDSKAIVSSTPSFWQMYRTKERAWHMPSFFPCTLQPIALEKRKQLIVFQV